MTKEGTFHAIIENHKVGEAQVLFHLDNEKCSSAHPHKVALQEEEISKRRATSLKELMTDMKKMCEGILDGKVLTCIRNTAVHSICTNDHCIVPDVLPASC